jgi:hypothetical protein
VTVVLTGEGGQAISGARVTVEGNMTHAGMVPVIADTRETNAGTYVAVGFRFSMAGDWFLTVRVVPDGGEPFERVFNVPGVTGGHP